MSILAIVLTILLGLVLLVWISRHLLLNRERRKADALTDDSPGVEGEAPSVSLLVAAKDEEENIEACVRSLLALDYPDFEVIACDDRSEDRTPGILDGIATEDPRLKVIHVTELPDGWCGKNNAMMTGIRTARGEWLCMTDADCRQTSTRTLSVAMRRALDSGADMLSVLPAFRTESFWENVIQPVCGGVMMIWFHPDKVNNAARSNAYANGAFMMIRRSAYEAIGTHEAVKTALMEDLAMARRVKRSGLALRIVRGLGLYSVRMYETFRATLRGWRRIFFGTFGSMRRLATALTLVLLMSLLPWVGTVLGFALAAAGGTEAGWWLACGIVGATAVAVQLSVIVRFYRLLEGKPGLAWTYPLGCLAAAWCLFRAILMHRPGARVTWRGTTYAAATPGRSQK